MWNIFYLSINHFLSRQRQDVKKNEGKYFNKIEKGKKTWRISKIKKGAIGGRNTDNEVLMLVFSPERRAWMYIWIIYLKNWCGRKLGQLRHGKWKNQFNVLSFKSITTRSNLVLILLEHILQEFIRMHQRIHKWWDRKGSIYPPASATVKKLA